MSFTISTEVQCDECGEVSDGTYSLKIEKMRAKRIAKVRGYRRIDGKDYCAVCAWMLYDIPIPNDEHGYPIAFATKTKEPHEQKD